MKKIIMALVLAITSTRAWCLSEVDFSWTETTPICSTTVTKGCVNSFTLAYPAAGEGAVVTVLALSINAFNWYPSPFLGPGTYQFTIQANGFDANGNPATSIVVNFPPLTITSGTIGAPVNTGVVDQ